MTFAKVFLFFGILSCATVAVAQNNPNCGSYPQSGGKCYYKGLSFPWAGIGQGWGTDFTFTNPSNTDNIGVQAYLNQLDGTLLPPGSQVYAAGFNNPLIPTSLVFVPTIPPGGTAPIRIPYPADCSLSGCVPAPGRPQNVSADLVIVAGTSVTLDMIRSKLGTISLAYKMTPADVGSVTWQSASSAVDMSSAGPVYMSNFSESPLGRDNSSQHTSFAVRNLGGQPQAIKVSLLGPQGEFIGVKFTPDLPPGGTTATNLRDLFSQVEMFPQGFTGDFFPGTIRLEGTVSGQNISTLFLQVVGKYSMTTVPSWKP